MILKVSSNFVDYLESENHVFFVYYISNGRTITLQKLIETKYGMKIGPQKIMELLFKYI